MTDETLVPTIDAFRLHLEDRSDTSGLKQLMQEGCLKPDDIVAVTGTTEGFGHDDTSRMDADRAVRSFLSDYGSRSDEAIASIPMVFTTGGMGILAPHIVVYTRSLAPKATDGVARLALGVAQSERILPQWMTTTRLIDVNADTVRTAAANAGIAPEEIGYVVGKTFYPAMQAMAEARAAGHDLPDLDDRSWFRRSSGSAGLGVAIATGQMAMPDPADVGSKSEIYSSRVAIQCNPWKDPAQGGPHTQLIGFGNRLGAGGRLRVGNAVMTDSLDIDALTRALRDAGMEVGPGPLTPQQSARVVAVYIKHGLPAGDRLRGTRQTVDNPEYRNQVKAAVGGALASVLQHNMIWMSLPNQHQGPPGGGNLGVIVASE